MYGWLLTMSRIIDLCSRIECFQLYIQYTFLGGTGVDIYIKEVEARFTPIASRRWKSSTMRLQNEVNSFLHRSPAGFGYSDQAWEDLIITVILSWHIFCPAIGLYTNDVLFYQTVCISRYRIIAVCLFSVLYPPIVTGAISGSSW